jgi:hypothetical protein
VEDDRVVEAIRYLDLRGLRWDQQTPEQAARQLAGALIHRIGVDLSTLSDLPEGNPADGAETERVGTVSLPDRQVPIILERMRVGAGEDWLFSRTTVGRIPELGDKAGPDHWLADLLPQRFTTGQLGPLWT